jgi:hypothetical protein
MTAGENMILDALLSLSKSMSRIADELQKIREVVTYDHKKKISEVRKARFSKPGMVTESISSVDKRDDNLSKNTAIENIHDIISGKYIS